MSATSTKPHTFNAELSQLPRPLTALTAQDRWLLWRWVYEPSRDKWTKPPFCCCRPDAHASSNNSETWASYDAALDAVQYADGIGFALSDSEITGIDLDHCYDVATGAMDDWAAEIVAEAKRIGAYIEVTVSGTGLRVIGLTNQTAESSGRSVWKVDGAGEDAQLEIYRRSKGRYITISGKQLFPGSDELVNIDALIDGVTARFNRSSGNGADPGFAFESDDPLETLIRQGAPIGQRSEKFQSCVWSLANRGLSVDDIERKLSQYPAGIAAKYMNRPGRLREQIERSYGKWKQRQGSADPAAEGVSLSDFHAYMPMGSYIYEPTREMWPGKSVNARVRPLPVLDTKDQPVLDEDGKPKVMAATAWLDRNKPVEQMSWAPGQPMLIRNRLIADGGWIERNKVTTFNLYRPPVTVPGDAARAQPWLNHVRKLYPDDADHIILWCAHRVQRPAEKINHALVLGGSQGIGKDTLLEPVKRAVGPWNFQEVSPQQIMGRFNGFLKSVILRLSEARDLGDVNRFQFYDHMKAYTAAPPDVLRCDEKHLREHSIVNCAGVIITTNHKIDGIYLPADDRRHYVAWSNLSKEDFTEAYWNDLYRWYGQGGHGHVAAYLAALDLSGFNAKAPPPKTAAFWDIVDANRAPEDAELADILDKMNNPDAATLIGITNNAAGDTEGWLKEPKNRRIIPHRLERCGYVPVRNDTAKDGLWKINGARQAVYARADLSLRDRLKAAHRLATPHKDTFWRVK
jgi:Family of unknown function (DUF5906)